MYRTAELVQGAQAVAVDAIRITRCFDIDPARAAAAAARFGGQACTSETELLGAGDVDVVLISLPPYLHAAAYAAAARAGKDVYLEKPVCVDAAGRALLVETAARHPVRCYVGLSYRYVGPFRAVAEILRRPEAGRIIGAHHHWLARRVDPIPADRLNWRHRLDQSGGQLIHHCCHLFDWFRWIGGEVSSVTCAIPPAAPGDPLPHEEREVTACFGWASGGQAVFNLSQHSHQYVQYGTVHTEHLGVRYQWGHETFVQVFRTRGRAADETYEWSMSEPRPEDDRDRLQMADFIAAYREGRPMPVGLDEAIRVYDMAVAARQSAREGRRIGL